MYRVQVYKITRGFWGPKKKVVVDEMAMGIVQLQKLTNPFEGNDDYAITIIDNSAYYPRVYDEPEENIDDRELPVETHHDHDGEEIPF